MVISPDFSGVVASKKLLFTRSQQPPMCLCVWIEVV